MPGQFRPPGYYAACCLGAGYLAPAVAGSCPHNGIFIKLAHCVVV